MELLSSIRTLSELNTLESNNNLFITGCNRLLANGNTKVSRDFYLLLMVHVKYFCFPVLSFIINGIVGRGIQYKFTERADIVCMPTAALVEDGEYVCKLPFPYKEQVDYIFLSENLYHKTVLL